MKFLYLFLFFSFANSEKFIKNINVNPCRKCIHFNSKYGDSSLSKCEKFGEKNIISNEIKYDYADQCRKDDTKCGEEGKYFEEDKYVAIKILTGKIGNDIPFTMSLTILLYSIIKLLDIWLNNLPSQ
jgi:hypothetical protein